MKKKIQYNDGMIMILFENLGNFYYQQTKGLVHAFNGLVTLEILLQYLLNIC